ncbi:hypothetical protein NKH10_20975 [Mesorhizobium sp. M1340]
MLRTDHPLGGMLSSHQLNSRETASQTVRLPPCQWIKEGGMISDQLFNNSAKSLQADERRPLLKKALFGCGRLEGIDRSLLIAMTGQAFLDHSDRFEPSRFGHVWPWLFKRFRSIGYRGDHRRLAIQVDCNRDKCCHFSRSPQLKAVKREDTARVA